MTISLLNPQTMLATFPTRDEFQIGSRLVWVEYPPYGERMDWLSVANSMLEVLLADIPNVIATALPLSQTAIPVYWAAQFKNVIPGDQLDVWCIRIDPVRRCAEYDVCMNHQFDHPGDVVHLIEEHSVDVSRDAEGFLKWIRVV
jgi:hypothetical protein